MPNEFSTDEFSRCEEALRLATASGDWDAATLAAVRKLVGETLAATVMATAALQPKARAKLGDGLWWCTERSLSQATPIQVSRLKAQWFDSTEIVDLCCGIGGDAIALGSGLHGERRVTAVDRDPTMVAMARENLRLNGRCAGGEFLCMDAERFELSPQSGVHLDPDRRNESGRKVRPEDYSPCWNDVLRLVSKADSAVIKTAPAAEIDDESDRHRVWASLSGSVREQSVLFGTAIERASDSLGKELRTGARTAVVLDAEGGTSSFSDVPLDASVATTDSPGAYIVEIDPAIRAAGLTEAFAERNSLQCIGGAAGFLSADEIPTTGVSVVERVIWTGSCDDRKLRRTLRSMNCYPWRVKTRGVEQNPNVLEKRFRQCGDAPVTLWIGRSGRRRYAAISEKL